jgi:GNAT superfamily N-acetyltransferase
MRLRLLTAADADEVQRVLEAAPDYARRVSGLPVGEADALSLFDMLPEGKTLEDKFVWGIFAPGLEGVIDVIRGYPDQSTAFIGLLLLRESAQGRGLRRQAFSCVQDEVERWPQIETLRLAVVDTNDPAKGYWEAMGFTATGETKPYRHASVRSTVRLFERPVRKP